MKVWKVEDGFILDEEAPDWATKAGWCYSTHMPGSKILMRFWLDEYETKYQYLVGYSGSSAPRVTFDGNIVNHLDSPVHIFAVKVEAEPMVCHNQFGFMAQEFHEYSYPHWKTLHETAQGIIAQAIRDGG